jgi:hypothetical protein
MMVSATATLARVRLRGLYAILAGGILLLGVPIFQALFLAPEGYIEAVAPAASRRDFGPLLLWDAQHAGAQIAYHLLQLVAFLLIVPLPSALRRVLWPERGDRTSAAVALLGTAGVLAYAAAIVLGIVTTSVAAASYAASNALDRPAIAAGFVNTYAFTIVLAQIIGGTLLGISIALASWRMVRTALLLPWVGYLGLLLAGLLIVTAIQFSADPVQVGTTLSPFSVATLALWLVCIGVLLSSVRALPAEHEADDSGAATVDEPGTAGGRTTGDGADGEGANNIGGSAEIPQ